MNDFDPWLFFDGAEPEPIRKLFEALRDVPPSTPEEKERSGRRIGERRDLGARRE